MTSDLLSTAMVEATGTGNFNHRMIVIPSQQGAGFTDIPGTRREPGLAIIRVINKLSDDFKQRGLMPRQQEAIRSISYSTGKWEIPRR